MFLNIRSDLWVCEVMQEDKYFTRPKGIYTFRQFNMPVIWLPVLSINSSFLIWGIPQQANSTYLWPGSADPINACPHLPFEVAIPCRAQPETGFVWHAKA